MPLALCRCTVLASTTNLYEHFEGEMDAAFESSTAPFAQHSKDVTSSRTLEKEGLLSDLTHQVSAAIRKALSSLRLDRLGVVGADDDGTASVRSLVTARGRPGGGSQRKQTQAEDHEVASNGSGGNAESDVDDDDDDLFADGDPVRDYASEALAASQKHMGVVAAKVKKPPPKNRDDKNTNKGKGKGKGKDPSPMDNKDPAGKPVDGTGDAHVPPVPPVTQTQLAHLKYLRTGQRAAPTQWLATYARLLAESPGCTIDDDIKKQLFLHTVRSAGQDLAVVAKLVDMAPVHESTLPHNVMQPIFHFASADTKADWIMNLCLLPLLQDLVDNATTDTITGIIKIPPFAEQMVSWVQPASASTPAPHLPQLMQHALQHVAVIFRYKDATADALQPPQADLVAAIEWLTRPVGVNPSTLSQADEVRRWFVTVCNAELAKPQSTIGKLLGKLQEAVFLQQSVVQIQVQLSGAVISRQWAKCAELLFALQQRKAPPSQAATAAETALSSARVETDHILQRAVLCCNFEKITSELQNAFLGRGRVQAWQLCKRMKKVLVETGCLVADATDGYAVCRESVALLDEVKTLMAPGACEVSPYPAKSCPAFTHQGFPKI